MCEINDPIPVFNFEVFVDGAWIKTAVIKNNDGTTYTVPYSAEMVIYDGDSLEIATVTATLEQVGVEAHITFAMTAAQMVAAGIVEGDYNYKSTMVEDVESIPLCTGTIIVI